MHGLQPCGALVACGRRLFLQAISPPFLVVSSSTKKHDVGRVFFNLCKVYLHKFVRFLSKSRVEPVVCARRLRILRALIAFACRQQLIKYRLFTTKTSCFFNVCKKFCTHLHNFSEIVRGASSALGDREYFVLSSPSLTSSSSNIHHFLRNLRVFLYN